MISANPPIHRAYSRFAPSQSEMALLCNNVSHWQGASLESALCMYQQAIPEPVVTFLCGNLRKPFIDVFVLNLNNDVLLFSPYSSDLDGLMDDGSITDEALLQAADEACSWKVRLKAGEDSLYSGVHYHTVIFPKKMLSRAPHSLSV